MHLHLDAVGGIAGDMFVAALLDLVPELSEGALAAARACSLLPVQLTHAPHSDGILTGSRFIVSLASETHEHDSHRHTDVAHDHADTHTHHHHGHPHDHKHAHAHVQWTDLRAHLSSAPLAINVRDRAIAMFQGLADAEAKVHGKPVEAVSFHEVGAWDSIADIVAAAWLIDAIKATGWSVGPLPLGSGRITTAHGVLPVPAPATALLLQGFSCFDDGRPGERITPTGAAILKHLAPASGLGPAPRTLNRVGHGFGARRMPGISNVLRLLAFDPPTHASAAVDEVTSLSFEVDDQTPEDLAVGLEHLRAVPDVLDVIQGTAIGKHGRQTAAVRVLAKPAATERVVAACFRETTTLGVRITRTERRVLMREVVTAPDGTRVKLAQRLGANTAKAELADVQSAGDHVAREARRASAESAALDAQHKPPS